jgi:hypothetical protein
VDIANNFLPKVQYRALVDGTAFAKGFGDHYGFIEYSEESRKIVPPAAERH